LDPGSSCFGQFKFVKYVLTGRIGALLIGFAAMPRQRG